MWNKEYNKRENGKVYLEVACILNEMCEYSPATSSYSFKDQFWDYDDLCIDEIVILEDD